MRPWVFIAVLLCCPLRPSSGQELPFTHYTPDSDRVPLPGKGIEGTAPVALGKLRPVEQQVGGKLTPGDFAQKALAAFGKRLRTSGVQGMADGVPDLPRADLAPTQMR